MIERVVGSSFMFFWPLSSMCQQTKTSFIWCSWSITSSFGCSFGSLLRNIDINSNYQLSLLEIFSLPQKRPLCIQKRTTFITLPLKSYSRLNLRHLSELECLSVFHTCNFSGLFCCWCPSLKVLNFPSCCFPQCGCCSCCGIALLHAYLCGVDTAGWCAVLT